MTDTDKKIEGHAYDGIEELDNGLPSWWINGFYLTILFAGLYFGYYMLGSGPALVDEYNTSRETHEQAIATKKSARPVASEEQLAASLKDPGKVKLGASVYASKCIACHGDRGQGGIGPNLTDEYWIHGGNLTQIMKTVSEGVLDKGMPPWGAVLTADELPAVVAFVNSLIGTKPTAAKAPQGVRAKE